MLPGMDGYQVCREIRHSSTCRSSCSQRKEKSSTKSWDWNWARTITSSNPLIPKNWWHGSKQCSAASRRHGRYPQHSQTRSVWKYPDLIINQTNYSVIYQGKAIDMPPKELELLYFLASSPNQVFTREQLLDHIWGYEYIGDTRTVDVHIKRLRKRSKIMKPGPSALSGASDINLRSKHHEPNTLQKVHPCLRHFWHCRIIVFLSPWVPASSNSI